jgi:hypothetical protein
MTGPITPHNGAGLIAGSEVRGFLRSIHLSANASQKIFNTFTGLAKLFPGRGFPEHRVSCLCRTLQALQRLPLYFSLCKKADHLRHLSLSIVNSVRRGSEDDMEERHAESQCSRTESHYDRGDGQNDCG